jgi:prolyl oligopeptidase
MADRSTLFRAGFIPALCALVLSAPSTGLAAGTARPETPRIEVTDTVHGVEIVDPYRWLEDQQSPETRAWIDAQNEYTQAVLAPLAIRPEIRDDLEKLMRTDKISRPIHRNGRYFFTRRAAEQDLDVICMREGSDGEDLVIVDPHLLSPDHKISAGIMGVSQDGKLLAYGLRESGEDERVLKILDVDTGENLPDEFAKSRYYDIMFDPEGAGFYYGDYDSLGERVYYHILGSDPAGDRLTFGGDLDPEMGLSVALSEDGRFILYSVYHGSAARKSEIYFQDLAAGGDVQTVVNTIDARFDGKIGGTTLFMSTTWKAPKGRIIAVDLENPSRQNWKEIVPEGKGTITDFMPAGGRLMVRYLYNVTPSIKIFEAGGEYLTAVKHPEIGWLGSMAGRWSDSEAFFSYSTYHTPKKIYSLNMESLETGIWAEVKNPLDAGEYEVKQVWFSSKDGTRVPMYVTHKKDLAPDGNTPTLLTGYGGFNSSQVPYYSSRAALWLNSGGVYAVANLRGGGEFGDKWHRDGILDKKQNTFDDFITAAEALIDEGYTNPEKLAIMGGSNGGLLVGAALTQRPDLFKAVVCTYPLLDMVRFHKFLVAKWWVPEYGSADDPSQFEYIHAYSPYHNVEKGADYPAVLFITGDADTRVAPLHARKMAALLQWATGSDEPVLLHYNTEAGHSGGRPLSDVIEDATDRMVFLYWQLGLEP